MLEYSLVKGDTEYTARKSKISIRYITYNAMPRKIRAVCKVCKKRKKGGYFSVTEEEIKKGLKCPYCGSTKIKILG